MNVNIGTLLLVSLLYTDGKKSHYCKTNTFLAGLRFLNYISVDCISWSSIKRCVLLIVLIIKFNINYRTYNNIIFSRKTHIPELILHLLS